MGKPADINDESSEALESEWKRWKVIMGNCKFRRTIEYILIRILDTTHLIGDDR